MNVSVSNVTQQATTAVVPTAKLPEVDRNVPKTAAQPVHDTVTLSGQMPQKITYGDPRIGRNRAKPAVNTDPDAETANEEKQPAPRQEE